MENININLAWDELRAHVAACKKCKLCETRHNTVLGEGPINTRVVLIGEGPGQEEDETGRPFVGKAGRLLTQILEKGGNIPRDSVYIMNMVKCRPPENRNPNLEEILACRDFLEQQLLLLHPDIIVSLGNVPTQALLNTRQGISALRGHWLEWRGVMFLPMFHPSYLLRESSRAAGSPKDLTWQDVRSLKAKIDELNNK